MVRTGIGLGEGRFDEVDHLGLVVDILVVREGEKAKGTAI
jgi:hypothetical protein